MTKLKKIISLILAFVCVVAFSACGNDEDKSAEKDKTEATAEKGEPEKDKKADKDAADDKKEDENPTEEETVDVKAEEEAAKKAAEAFLDAFCNMDLDSAANLTDDETVFDETSGMMDAGTLAMLLPGILEEEIADVLDSVKLKFADSMEYTFTAMEKVGENYSFSYKLTKPEPMNETALIEAMTDEQLAFLFSMILPDESTSEGIDTEAVKTMINGLTLKTETEDITLTVLKKDDKWLVSGENAKTLVE